MGEGGGMSQLAGAERNLFRSLSGAPLIQEDMDAEARQILSSICFAFAACYLDRFR